MPFLGFVAITDKTKALIAGLLALIMLATGLCLIWFHQLRVERQETPLLPQQMLVSTERCLITVIRFLMDNTMLIIVLSIASALGGYFIWRMIVRFTSPLKTLEQAISRREILPFYQPFVDSDTGKIAGFEVLARWKHPTYGYVSPEVFIPLAERHRLIIPLTHLLIKQIISDLKQEIHRFPDGIYICINISPQNCLDPHFEDDISDILLSLEAKKRRIVIEITERHPLHITPQLNDWFAALRRANVAIALDDFGTCYSNLAYISALNPEFLKIDKMFVSQIGENTDTRLIESVIDIARKMQLKVIAEGVETQAQVDYLRSKQIDYMQGYFFSRPLSAADLLQRMALETSVPSGQSLTPGIPI